MKIIPYKEVEPAIFDNDVAKGVTGRVLIGQADGAANFCMRIFEVAQGGHSPRHTHDWEHEIFVHQGEGELLTGKGWVPVSAGTAIFIPGGEEHQMRNTYTAPLVFVCLVPKGAPEL